MSIFRSIQQPIQRMPFMAPPPMGDIGGNPWLVRQQQAEAQAQEAMKHGGLGGGGGLTNQIVSQIPVGAPGTAPSPVAGGAPAAASQTGNGGLMSSIASLFGRGGGSGGLDISAILSMLGGAM